jgi:hypothetical protein
VLLGAHPDELFLAFDEASLVANHLPAAERLRTAESIELFETLFGPSEPFDQIPSG